jgi:hypothetical protein
MPLGRRHRQHVNRGISLVVRGAWQIYRRQQQGEKNDQYPKNDDIFPAATHIYAHINLPKSSSRR